MGALDNVAVVKEWFRRLSDGEYDRMHELETDDVEWDIISGASVGIVPWLGTFRGAAGVKDCLGKWAAAAQSESFELFDFLTAGDDRVAVVGRTRVVARPTGRRFEINFVEYIRLNAGKIAYVRVFGDSAAASAAFR